MNDFALWAFLTPYALFIISFFKPLLLPRYFIFTAVPFIFLIVHAVESIKSGYVRVSVLGILFIFTIHFQILQIYARTKSDIRGKVREISAVAKPTDLLYVTSELDFHTVQYYFGVEKVFIYAKDYQAIPAYVGKVLIPKDKIVHSLPVFPKRAIILDNKGNYSVQTMY